MAVLVVVMATSTISARSAAGSARAAPKNEVVYHDCREQSVLLPVPFDVLRPRLPRGFTPQTVGAFLGFPSPAGDAPVGAYNVVTLSCNVLGEPAIVQELSVPVEPPASRRRAKAVFHFVVLDAVADRPDVVAEYAHWCAPMRLGRLNFHVQTTPVASVGRAGGTGAAEMLTEVTVPMTQPAGVGRLFWRNGKRLSVLDVTEPPTNLVIGSATVHFDDVPPPTQAPAQLGLGAHLSYRPGSANRVSPVRTCRE